VTRSRRLEVCLGDLNYDIAKQTSGGLLVEELLEVSLASWSRQNVNPVTFSRDRRQPDQVLGVIS
jgi:hypothetical protein